MNWTGLPLCSLERSVLALRSSFLFFFAYLLLQVATLLAVWMSSIPVKDYQPCITAALGMALIPPLAAFLEARMIDTPKRNMFLPLSNAP